MACVPAYLRLVERGLTISTSAAPSNQCTFIYFCACTLYQAAGITRPTSEISPSLAQEALEQLKHKINTLERELQDIKLKVKKEKKTLSKLLT